MKYTASLTYLDRYCQICKDLSTCYLTLVKALFRALRFGNVSQWNENGSKKFVKCLVVLVNIHVIVFIIFVFFVLLVVVLEIASLFRSRFLGWLSRYAFMAYNGPTAEWITCRSAHWWARHRTLGRWDWSRSWSWYGRWTNCWIGYCWWHGACSHSTRSGAGVAGGSARWWVAFWKRYDNKN